MLLRQESGGTVLAIVQPAHAALAGRLAQAWDDDVAPALVAAATHHDDVWAQRDANPPLGTGTGRPQGFLELEPAERVAVWSRAPEVAAPLGAEVELWVLRHAERLHTRYDEAAVKAMAAAISLRIAELVEELRATEPARFDDAALARGTSLLALWDTLSLVLCFGVDATRGAGVLHLAPTPDGVAVAPWPFRGDRLATWVEARRLPDGLADQAALDAAWALAPPERVPVLLVRPA